jgi:hypothetical protein
MRDFLSFSGDSNESRQSSQSIRSNQSIFSKPFWRAVATKTTFRKRSERPMDEKAGGEA